MDTNLTIDLRGRLRNFRLPASRALVPVFEAVINALHAIDATKSSGGRVIVEILRGTPQAALPLGDESAKAPLAGFRIKDDGVGFTDENYASFCTSDSTFKAGLGGRGVGRFTWLKAFKKVQIDSTYRTADSKLRRRRFSFSETGISELPQYESEGSRSQGTVVLLEDMEAQYLRHIPKRLATLGQRLVDHCFMAIRATRHPVAVEIHDGDERFDVSAQVREMFSTALTDELEISGEHFHVTHLQVTSDEVKGHRLAFLANKREVCSDTLGQSIASLRGKLSDRQGRSFWWLSLVESRVLDNAVSSERDAFLLPDEEELDSLFPEQPSLQLIRKALRPVILRRLEPYLAPVKVRTVEQVRREVS